jgi:hypothetical protein
MAKTPRFFVDKNATGSIGIEKIEHKIMRKRGSRHKHGRAAI